MYMRVCTYLYGRELTMVMYVCVCVCYCIQWEPGHNCVYVLLVSVALCYVWPYVFSAWTTHPLLIVQVEILR